MTYGFIGCGNMGGALIGAAAKAVNGGDILIADINVDKMVAVSKATGTQISTIEDVAGKADMIFLGVKPQSMDDMLSCVKKIFAKRINDGERLVLVSMAAAVSIDRLKGMLDVDGNADKFSIIRIMPNLAAAVGEGMMLYCLEGTSEEEIETFKNLMAPSGKILEIKEEEMDAGCAVSGCGPAFAYMFIEAMAKGGEACGLKKDDALLLATQTVLGAAKNMRESGKDPRELVKAVCSPGGTTIEGVKSIENGDLYNEMKKAVEASYKRAKEM